MKFSVKTIRFTCDDWYYKGGFEWEKTDCPNTLLLTGTNREIENMFERSGWKRQENLIAQTAIEKHTCPRKHGEASLGVRTPLRHKQIGLSGGIPVYEVEAEPESTVPPATSE
jgi:hypothetical protein